MKSDLLDLELRLLIARYGRERVIERLAKLADVSHDALEAAVAGFEAQPPRSTKRHVKTAEQVASELTLDEQRADAIRTLARRYDAGTFLGTLREVSSLLSRNKSNPETFRSRKSAAAAVVRFLATQSPDLLQGVIKDLDEGAGKSEYQRLAHRIMGRPDE